MSARDVGEAAAFAEIADFLGGKYVEAAADAADLRAQIAALQAEVDELKKAATPLPNVQLDGLTGTSGSSGAAFNNFDLLEQGGSFGS